jgi:hypothetical protein
MSEIRQYLDDYHSGKIKKGLGINCPDLDSILRYKQGQFNIINGLDNVGKTAWIMWYFLCLAYLHNKTFLICSVENKAGMLVRQMIEMLSGQRLKDLSIAQVYQYEAQISHWFEFIPNTKTYKNTDLYKLAEQSDKETLLIDPYTGMDREYTHAANYDFLNQTREFCNKTNITCYVNTHPNSEAARRTYGDGHELSGYAMPPSKSQTEGGQPFANRPDDFITIHRLVGHPLHQYNTLVYTRKIKDTETGGQVTAIDAPVSFDFNKGLGFTCGGYNPLKKRVEQPKPEFETIKPNNDFGKVKKPSEFSTDEFFESL